MRLPSGLTARYFAETRRTRPSFTFEGVSFTDGTCVGVAYIDLRDEEPITELPEGIMCYLEREYHGNVSVADQCEIRLGRHPGRQITYESASGAQRKSYSRWFLVGNRLYNVTWIAGYSQPSISAVQEFLDSFHLLAEPQVRGHVDPVKRRRMDLGKVSVQPLADERGDPPFPAADQTWFYDWMKQETGLAAIPANWSVRPCTRCRPTTTGRRPWCRKRIRRFASCGGGKNAGRATGC